LILQEKINNYISFYENKQYDEIYPDNDISYCIIKIHFMYDITEKTESFLQVVRNNVEEIGKFAFGGCTSLKSVTIPKSVTNIGEEAFKDCKSLTITCNKGSYAEKYAKKNNIPVKHIKDKTIERE
jgi:hypothetical protein